MATVCVALTFFIFLPLSPGRRLQHNAESTPVGEITATELGSVMESLGLKPSKTELEDIMNEIDVDQSGTISFDGKSLGARKNWTI